MLSNSGASATSAAAVLSSWQKQMIGEDGLELAQEQSHGVLDYTPLANADHIANLKDNWTKACGRPSVL